MTARFSHRDAKNPNATALYTTSKIPHSTDRNGKARAVPESSTTAQSRREEKDALENHARIPDDDENDEE
jgi:hypothetical protein